MPTFDVHSFLNQFIYDPKNPLLFNNGFFVCFFTLFICLYYTFKNNFAVRRYIFCFFSLYFFYKASGYFVGLVIISAIVDFIVSNAIYRQQRKNLKLTLLLFSIVFNIGLPKHGTSSSVPPCMALLTRQRRTCCSAWPSWHHLRGAMIPRSVSPSPLPTHRTANTCTAPCWNTSSR